MALKIQTAVIAALILAAACVSCAKDYNVETNAAAKRFFDAYMAVHYPEAKPIGYGIYVLEDSVGTGEYVKDSNYLFIDYIYTTMATGEIAAYNGADMAKHQHEYDSTNYYGPYIFQYMEGNCSAGIMNGIIGGGDYDRMRMGGRRKIVMPGWLSGTTTWYTSEAQYLANVTGVDYIFEMKMIDQVEDIYKWQLDNIYDYMLKRGPETVVDSTAGGVFYWRDRNREEERGVTVLDSVTLRQDTTIYINYIGRRLDGQVFDTTIKDTAKVWGIYDESNDYEPVLINCSSDSTEITMTSSASTIITGFARTIWEMHPFESGQGIFTSAHGYGSSGSGDKIPEYAPLVFEIDVVEEEDE